MSIIVEPKIKIRRREITLVGFLNVVIGLILLGTLLLPWINVSLTATAPSYRSGVIYGDLRLTGNGFGGLRIIGRMDYQYGVGEQMMTSILFNIAYYYLSPLPLAIGIVSFIGALLTILSGLADGGVLKIRIFSEKKDLMGIIGSSLAVLGGVIYGLLVNMFSLGQASALAITIPERGINLILEYSTVGEFKVAIFKAYTALAVLKQAGVSLKYSYYVAPGLLLWALLSAILLTLNVHYPLLTRKYRLRTAWKLRIDSAIMTFVMMLYPIAGFVKLSGTTGTVGVFFLFLKVTTTFGESISRAITIDIYALVALIMLVLVVFLTIFAATKTAPGILMRAEEFIRFDLPPDELARRSKLLPVYISYVSRIKLLVGFLWLIALVTLFGFLLKTLLPLHLSLAKFETGFLWVEPFTVIAIGIATFGLLTHLVYLD
ncbi:MAG: hypothetical protein ACTSX9_08305 [Candidatus Njordarchaeales archaeon]